MVNLTDSKQRAYWALRDWWRLKRPDLPNGDPTCCIGGGIEVCFFCNKVLRTSLDVSRGEHTNNCPWLVIAEIAGEDGWD